MRLHDGDDETTPRGDDVQLAGLSGEGGWEESLCHKERDKEERGERRQRHGGDAQLAFILRRQRTNEQAAAACRGKWRLGKTRKVAVRRSEGHLLHQPSQPSPAQPETYLSPRTTLTQHTNIEPNPECGTTNG